jgi:RimJ/RimL family protein N-acetyltransferase
MRVRSSDMVIALPEEIHSQNLVLRLPRVGFGQAMFDVIQASLLELKPWMDWAQNPPTQAECELECSSEIKRIAAGTAVIYHLFSLEGGAFLGEIGFSVIDWQARSFEMRGWMDSRYTRKGLMTEAVNSLCDLAFKTLEAKRVFMHCDSRNSAARKLAEKAGFALERVLEKSVQDVQDSSLWLDQCVFARVN